MLCRSCQIWFIILCLFNFQSLKSNSFDHIYAIYNLLVDKLHQRTINFQSKITSKKSTDSNSSKPLETNLKSMSTVEAPTLTSLSVDTAPQNATGTNHNTFPTTIDCLLTNENLVAVATADASDALRQLTTRHRINERSESFNDRLVDQSFTGVNRKDSLNDGVQETVRRESFNESCLRDRDGAPSERRSSFNENEAMGSPFVSMPTIPAVYLSGDSTQPLEKVTFIYLFNERLKN